MKDRSFLTGLGLGVMLTFLFIMAVSVLDNEKAYSVYTTDSNEVKLLSEEGNFISIHLENVPDVSCFETGALWIIEY